MVLCCIETYRGAIERMTEVAVGREKVSIDRQIDTPKAPWGVQPGSGIPLNEPLIPSRVPQLEPRPYHPTVVPVRWGVVNSPVTW